jgi:cysteine-rich repeat protein
MEASYEGVRRALHPDDAAAVAFLYPCVGTCGDGTLATGEACDDGNCGEGDGCSATCTREPLCGDAFCDPGESCTCAIDCGAGPASELHVCADGIDNDCDTLTDCSDPDCGPDLACLCRPKDAPCAANADCCSRSCKGKAGSKTCR